MNRQGSKEKKINLLPKTSSSRSLKPSTIISKLPSNTEQYFNESQTDMMNIKSRMNSNLPENNQIITKREKFLSAQQLPIKQNFYSDHHIQEK
jgi:hypothetical protein